MDDVFVAVVVIVVYVVLVVFVLWCFVLVHNIYLIFLVVSKVAGGGVKVNTMQNLT